MNLLAFLFGTENPNWAMPGLLAGTACDYFQQTGGQLHSCWETPVMVHIKLTLDMVPDMICTKNDVAKFYKHLEQEFLLNYNLNTRNVYFKGICDFSIQK